MGSVVPLKKSANSAYLDLKNILNTNKTKYSFKDNFIIKISENRKFSSQNKKVLSENKSLINDQTKSSYFCSTISN